ncbi:FmdE family protein [Lactonifactor longoviformis]|uniref:FmdE family protein n=1 Tax=Lactonifactor longoviformis TaxID=341220 RepID=UPI00210BBFA6|nr:FmdE family protein [Lactonifactor longoviformis]MCQ4671517.1 FmdE family protein [Lactonifactor longoviformis]
MKDRETLWKECAAFHGHECGGLAIGYQAALYAAELLELGFSHDEEVVCVTENDSCGVDAIQVILGCSVGKGNLLFRLRGKQAYSFYNRSAGTAVRLVLKTNRGKRGGDWENTVKNVSPKELFDVKEAKMQLPERARIFKSYECEVCHENTAESMLRIEDGRYVCLDCLHTYDRFGL